MFIPEQLIRWTLGICSHQENCHSQPLPSLALQQKNSILSTNWSQSSLSKIYLFPSPTTCSWGCSKGSELWTWGGQRRVVTNDCLLIKFGYILLASGSVLWGNCKDSRDRYIAIEMMDDLCQLYHENVEAEKSTGLPFANWSGREVTDSTEYKLLTHVRRLVK